jgi:hypothetical protein
MHKCLSYAISLVPVRPANTILRVSGRLPGLHPLALQGCAGITRLFAAINAPTPLIRADEKI